MTGAQHAPTPGKWWPHVRFTEGEEPEPWQTRNEFRIALTRDHDGVTADDGAAVRIYLNEYRKTGATPGRLAMARRVLAALNEVEA